MTKITRQTQKIFANAAANNGVIGSGQDGTKVLTNNLATLQSKGAWNTGWLDMVLGTKKFPPLEEFQALDYINTYQLSYLFQEGMPEYDSGTTYFINSWVKKAGTNQIYGSLTDTNVGNVLTDATKWKLLVDFDATVAFDLVLNYAVDTGTADHYIVAPSPAITAYAAGNVVFLKVLHGNTGACDLNVNAKGVKNIKLADGSDPLPGMMITTGFYCLAYDGTNFVLTNPTYIFGSAAFLAADNTPNNVVKVDSDGAYPALDGHKITNLPKSTYLIVRDEKPSGTNGGAATSGVWTTRTLNTTPTNTISGASVAANQFTLPAGTYKISARSPANGCSHKAKLYNVTDGADIIIGSSAMISGADDGNTDSWIIGFFTIAGAKVFEIRDKVTSNAALKSFGQQSSAGVNEVYTEVFIEKIPV